MTTRAAIVGIAGPALLPQETELLQATPPAGVILFARNIQDPAQLAALIAALRRILPPNADIMVDQEGGRVARLRPPDWRPHPAAATIGHLFATDPAAGLRAAWLTGALIGCDCRTAGFTIAATPVLDIAVPGAHDVIGDRPLPRTRPPSHASPERSPTDCLPRASCRSASTRPATAGPGPTPTLCCRP